MTEVEEIAAGLSEAHRQALLMLPEDQSWVEWTDAFPGIPKNHLRGFGKSGLIDGYYGKTEMRHRLTPLGLRVRSVLQGETWPTASPA